MMNRKEFLKTFSSKGWDIVANNKILAAGVEELSKRVLIPSLLLIGQKQNAHVWTIDEIEKLDGSSGWFYGLCQEPGGGGKIELGEIHTGMGYAEPFSTSLLFNLKTAAKDLTRFSPATCKQRLANKPNPYDLNNPIKLSYSDFEYSPDIYDVVD